MRRPVLPFHRLPLLTLVALAACGGGGGGGENDDGEEVVVLLTSVDPAFGSTDGGQNVVLLGQGFEDGNAGTNVVRFGGTGAAGVSVVSDTQLNVVTPARAAGTVDVTVENGNGFAELAGAFTFGDPPTVADVGSEYTRGGIAAGPTTGGTRILVAGSGFDSPNTPQVRVGGTLATDVQVLNANQLLATTAPRSDILADVLVTTEYGADSLPNSFIYEALRLYAAEGKGNPNGRLLILNPNTGAPGAIGTGTGFSIDGIAMSPAGVLFGVTRVASPATSQLVTIDVTTGVATVVADLRTSTNGRVDMVDIDFAGSSLYGFAQNFRRPVLINTATGLVSLFEFVDFGAGEALLVDESEFVYLLPENSGDDVWEFDPATGFSTVLVPLAGGGSFANGFYNSGTFLDGIGFAVESGRNASNTEPGGPSALRSINPATGASLQVGLLPDDVDAIAGNFR
jgi:hypothetical protein